MSRGDTAQDDRDEIPTTNSQATASFWLGIASIVLFPFAGLGLLLAFLGVILGIVARVRFRRALVTTPGRATAGTVLSGIGVVLGIGAVFAVLFLLNTGEAAGEVCREQNPRATQAQLDRCTQDLLDDEVRNR